MARLKTWLSVSAQALLLAWLAYNGLRQVEGAWTLLRHAELIRGITPGEVRFKAAFVLVMGVIMAGTLRHAGRLTLAFARSKPGWSKAHFALLAAGALACLVVMDIMRPGRTSGSQLVGSARP